MNNENLSRAINEVGRRRKTSSWRGYTLEELRTQRVVTQARILIERNRHIQMCANVVPGIKASSEGCSVHSLLSTML